MSIWCFKNLEGKGQAQEPHLLLQMCTKENFQLQVALPEEQDQNWPNYPQSFKLLLIHLLLSFETKFGLYQSMVLQKRVGGSKKTRQMHVHDPLGKFVDLLIFSYSAKNSCPSIFQMTFLTNPAVSPNQSVTQTSKLLLLSFLQVTHKTRKEPILGIQQIIRGLKPLILKEPFR